MCQTYQGCNSEYELKSSFVAAPKSENEIISLQRGRNPYKTVQRGIVKFKIGDRVVLESHKLPAAGQGKSHAMSRHWGVMYENCIGTIVDVAPYGVGHHTYKNNCIVQEARYLFEADDVANIGPDWMREDAEYHCINIRKFVIIGNSKVRKLPK